MKHPVRCFYDESQERRRPEMTAKEMIFAKAAKVADIILGGGGVTSFLILFYVIYYYGWTGQRQFVNLIGPALYYGFPAVLVVLLFACLRLRADHKVNLAIFFVALVTSLYGVELFLNLFRPVLEPKPIWLLEGASKEEKQKAAAKIAKQFGIEFDTRDRIEVIADLRKRGIDAVPAIIPKDVSLTAQRNEIREPSDLPMMVNGGMKPAIDIDGEKIVPLGGVANKVTVLCNESGQWIIYTSDEHGFNNPKGIWQTGQIDIAALGDSFTQGYCLPREKSFIGLIRQRYPATLNLGMAAHGPLYMLATLQEYLPSLKPKVVLWCYFEAIALRELQIEKKNALMMRSLNEGFDQGLLGMQNDIDEVLTNYIGREAAKAASKQAKTPDRVHELLEIIKMSTLREKLVHGQTPEGSELLSEVEGAGIALFREILSRAKADVSEWGGTLYFVYLPSWQRYAGSPDIGVKQRAQVLTAARTVGIPIIDIHSAFEAHSDVLSLFPFRGSGHYNEKGQKVIGEEIVKAISSTTP
jgi:hypothetical protein